MEWLFFNEIMQFNLWEEQINKDISTIEDYVNK